MSYAWSSTPGTQQFTVPGSSGNVLMYFLLVGPGGNGSSTVSGRGGGGSGGVFYGSASIPAGTTVYAYIPQTGGGNQQSTYIYITPVDGDGGLPAPEVLNRPYAWSGDNGDGGTAGAGGSWAWRGINQNILPSFDGIWNITVIAGVNGNAGTIGNDTTGGAPAWYPVSPLPIGIDLYPGRGGPPGNNNGDNSLVVLGFNSPIPWTTQSPYTDTETIPCFPFGTRILTPTGYKTVETLEQGSLVTTAANKNVPVKVYNRTIEVATSNTAPYLIPKHSFGASPTADLRLSPLHAFQIRKGIWQIPKYAALQNKEVKQYGVGESVTYYHVECPNFFTDNLVVDGNVVESFGGNQIKGLKTLYKYNGNLKGFTRASQPSKSPTM